MRTCNCGGNIKNLVDDASSQRTFPLIANEKILTDS